MIIIFIAMAVAFIIWYFVEGKSMNKSCEERHNDLAHKIADDPAIKIAGDFLARMEAIKQADIIGNETIKNAILSETY